MSPAPACRDACPERGSRQGAPAGRADGAVPRGAEPGAGGARGRVTRVGAARGRGLGQGGGDRPTAAAPPSKLPLLPVPRAASPRCRGVRSAGCGGTVGKNTSHRLFVTPRLVALGMVLVSIPARGCGAPAAWRNRTETLDLCPSSCTSCRGLPWYRKYGARRPGRRASQHPRSLPSGTHPEPSLCPTPPHPSWQRTPWQGWFWWHRRAGRAQTCSTCATTASQLLPSKVTHWPAESRTHERRVAHLQSYSITQGLPESRSSSALPSERPGQTSGHPAPWERWSRDGTAPGALPAALCLGTSTSRLRWVTTSGGCRRQPRLLTSLQGEFHNPCLSLRFSCRYHSYCLCV